MKRHTRRTAITVSALAALSVGTFALATANADAHTPAATATLRAADGTKLGKVRFFDDGHADKTVVKVDLVLPANAPALADFHGFHVHANDVPSNGDGCIADPSAAPATWFVSADGHLKHAATETHAGHAGDMPSLYVGTDGHTRATYTIDRIVPGELDGRAVILHAGKDNFGNVPVGSQPDQYQPNSPDATTKTANTGNAGDRYACGVLTTR